MSGLNQTRVGFLTQKNLKNLFVGGTMQGDVQSKLGRRVLCPLGLIIK